MDAVGTIKFNGRRGVTKFIGTGAAMRLNLSHKYSEQCGEELARNSKPWRRNGKFKRANGRNKTACESAAKFNR